jgi:hypothetical protein
LIIDCRLAQASMAEAVTLSPGVAGVEAMPTYRLYALDNHEHIAGPPQIITCDTDEEAIQQAQVFVDGRALELWELERLVARLEPKVPDIEF